LPSVNYNLEYHKKQYNNIIKNVAPPCTYENDVKPWYFIAKTKYKNKYKYVFYEAQCDYTGFDCQGIMKLYVSYSLKRLIKKAISKKIIKKYNLIKILKEELKEELKKKN
jgi:hypothetical protein